MQTPTANTEFQIELGEAERWSAGLAAALLIGYGTTRRSVPGYLIALGAAPLAYRAIAGRWPAAMGMDASDDTRVALSGSRGINVHESIRVEMPTEVAYRFWRNFENLPSFMKHLASVTQSSDGCSHWVANGPAGLKVAWDAEIINEVENELIAWRSLPGSDIVTAGSVTFRSVRDGRSTQLSVKLQYAAPAGKAGAYAAMLFGREPSQTIREDLRRFKQYLETGEMAQAVPPERQGVY